MLLLWLFRKQEVQGYQIWQTRACISQKEFTLRVDLFPKCESIHFPHFFMSQHPYLWNGLFAQFSIGTLGVAAVNMGSWENPVSASNIITFHALFRADGWSNKTPTGSVTNLVLPSLEVIICKNTNSCKLLLCVFIIYYKLWFTTCMVNIQKKLVKIYKPWRLSLHSKQFQPPNP